MQTLVERTLSRSLSYPADLAFGVAVDIDCPERHINGVKKK